MTKLSSNSVNENELVYINPRMTWGVTVEVILFETMGIIGIQKIKKNYFEVKVL